MNRCRRFSAPRSSSRRPSLHQVSDTGSGWRLARLACSSRRSAAKSGERACPSIVSRSNSMKLGRVSVPESRARRSFPLVARPQRASGAAFRYACSSWNGLFLRAPPPNGANAGSGSSRSRVAGATTTGMSGAACRITGNVRSPSLGGVVARVSAYPSASRRNCSAKARAPAVASRLVRSKPALNAFHCACAMRNARPISAGNVKPRGAW
jgi:hypothetical protein